LIIVFAVKLHWFDIIGWGEPRKMVLPVITLSMLPAASSPASPVPRCSR
jgi:ABC-type dipeptide/oligopeptide/nickel transport system permease component